MYRSRILWDVLGKSIELTGTNLASLIVLPAKESWVRFCHDHQTQNPEQLNDPQQYQLAITVWVFFGWRCMFSIQGVNVRCSIVGADEHDREHIALTSQRSPYQLSCAPFWLKRCYRHRHSIKRSTAKKVAVSSHIVGGINMFWKLCNDT